MNERIHDIRAEIKTIDQMLDSLSGPMHELALEEQKNLQFELDMLMRSSLNPGSRAEAEEHGQYA